MRSGVADMYATFGQSARCTETPLPIVTYPMIGSPGTGLQHFESRTSTSSTPAIRMPLELRAIRRGGGAGRCSAEISMRLFVVLNSSLSFVATDTADASPKPMAAKRSVALA